MGLGPPPKLTHQQLTGSATARPSRVAYHIPPVLSVKETREGREKRQGALDRPLAMSRGSGATLAPWPRPQIHTPHKSQALGRISYPSKASGATPSGCARAHPPEESSTKTSRGPGNDLAETQQRSNSTNSLRRSAPTPPRAWGLLSGTMIRDTQIRDKTFSSTKIKQGRSRAVIRLA
jgi:hypothetical protein